MRRGRPMWRWGRSALPPLRTYGSREAGFSDLRGAGHRTWEVLMSSGQTGTQPTQLRLAVPPQNDSIERLAIAFEKKRKTLGDGRLSGDGPVHAFGAVWFLQDLFSVREHADYGRAAATADGAAYGQADPFHGGRSLQTSLRCRGTSMPCSRGWPPCPPIPT